MANLNITQQELDNIFPATIANEFFEALYGEAEEGAYDIKLVLQNSSGNNITFAFELHQRPEKCLACNLTYGLPQVFQRHPIINISGVVKKLADKLGLDMSAIKWSLGKTQEQSREFHYIPLNIEY